MNKNIAAAAFTAALLFATPYALAADDAGMKTAADGATGAAGNQPADQPTSNRTPEKPTTTPPTQVDKTDEGATSDRTPKENNN